MFLAGPEWPTCCNNLLSFHCYFAVHSIAHSCQDIPGQTAGAVRCVCCQFHCPYNQCTARKCFECFDWSPKFAPNSDSKFDFADYFSWLMGPSSSQCWLHRAPSHRSTTARTKIGSNCNCLCSNHNSVKCSFECHVLMSSQQPVINLGCCNCCYSAVVAVDKSVCDLPFVDRASLGCCDCCCHCCYDVLVCSLVLRYRKLGKILIFFFLRFSLGRCGKLKVLSKS